MESNQLEVVDNNFLELKDYIRIFRRYRNYLIPTILIGLLISFWFYFSSIPSYRSSTLILIEDNNLILF